MDQNLLKLIESAGFTDKEARIYLALLELGQGDVTDIAKISNLKRAIIYVILEGLIKRGYVSQFPDRKINTYRAVDPAIILSQLKITTKNFSEMLPFMQTLANKGKKKPKISFFETKDAIWSVYQQMSNAKEYFFITSYTDIKKHFPKAIEEWVKDYKLKKVKPNTRHLISNNQNEKEIAKIFMETGQEVRFLPETKNFNMDFTIFENKLAITSFKENPFMLLIESEVLIKSMMLFFELAWEKGVELK
jgi:HTH-type transcriptional regulator, sugar sensing transcriptional regulator